MIIFVSLWAFAANWLAFSKGFYRIPKQLGKETPLITNFQLFTIFGLYLLLSYGVTRFLLLYFLSSARRADPTISSLPISMITGIQFGVMAILFLILQWVMFEQNKSAARQIWKDKTHTPPSASIFDLGLGAITWFMCFPIVSILGDLIDLALKTLFHFQEYEQNAVKFVKIALNSPTSLIFALLSVLMMAPLVEEFLFRGVLQTYLKKRMGPHAAILLSALSFALFHFSPGQGIGNVSLIISLLILGSFLGFLYERQGSLWAPIGLHIAFNAVSALRIIISPELS